MCGMVGLEVIQSPPREWGGAGRIGRGQGWGLGSLRSGATRPQSISSPPREWGGAGRIGRGQGWGLGSWRSGVVWYLSPHRERGGAASCRTDRPERPSARGEDGRRERGAGWGRGCRYAHGAERKRTQRAPFLRGTSKKGGSGADAERRGTIIIL